VTSDDPHDSTAGDEGARRPARPGPDESADEAPHPVPPGDNRERMPAGFRRFAWPPEPLRQTAPRAAARVGRATPAGLGPRFAATLIDAVLVGIAWLAASVLFVEALTALGSLDPSVLDPASLNGFALTDTQFRLGAFTYAIFVAIRGFYLVYAWTAIGATFGQQAVGIRVVDATTGRPPSLGRSLIRWLVNDLPGISLLIGVGMLVWYAALGVSIRRDVSRRGFHDEASRCLVVQQSSEGAGGAVE